jgi:hypothetical protein
VDSWRRKGVISGVASVWDPGSVSAGHAGLHTFSIYHFAYDSLCMMDRLAVAAKKLLGA